jgi:hypothetical protein
MLPERRYHFDYRNWRLDLVVGPGQRLSLYANDCLRKTRAASEPRPLYVWTNVELEWEEHHLIEARLQPLVDGAALVVTSNGEPFFEERIAFA